MKETILLVLECGHPFTKSTFINFLTVLRLLLLSNKTLRTYKNHYIVLIFKQCQDFSTPLKIRNSPESLSKISACTPSFKRSFLLPFPFILLKLPFLMGLPSHFKSAFFLLSVEKFWNRSKGMFDNNRLLKKIAKDYK